MIEFLMTITASMSLSVMIALFLVGSLATILSLEQVAKTFNLMFFPAATIFVFVALPLVLNTLGTDIWSVTIGFAAILAVGAFLQKVLQLALIYLGCLEYEDIFRSNS